MSFNLRAAQQHIGHLTRRNGLVRRFEPKPSSAVAWVNLGVVSVPTVKSPASYAVCLHEIGHIMTPWRRVKKMWREAFAWEWAVRNALWWNPMMTRTMQACLLTHVESLDKRYKRPWKGHIFWLLGFGDHADIVRIFRNKGVD